MASLPLVARLSHPKGVVLLAAIGGSFGGGCGEGDRFVLVVLAGPPQGTEGREAEKFGNLEGLGGGFIGCSFSLAAEAVTSIDCARDFTDCVSVVVVTEDCLFFSEAFDTCDWVLWRATGTAVAS